MTPRLLVLTSLFALSLVGCDGRAEAAVSTAYLDAAAEAAPDTVGVPVSERLWTWPAIDGDATQDPDISYGDPSPDGRLVSLVDWATGNLAVREAATGSVHYVTKDADWSTGYHMWWSTFSPDGASIAFTWWSLDDQGQEGYELRVVDSEGSGEPRVLMRVPGSGVLRPTDWGQPGILAMDDRRADSIFRIVIVDPEDGDSRAVLESPEPIERPVFSPDGNTIAFDRGDEIQLMPTAGGEVRTTGIAASGIVGWPKNGEGLYFYDRQGDIRVVAAADQRTVGLPRLVRRDGAGWGIGTSDDALFTSVQLDGRRIYVAEVDGEGRMLGEPRPISPLSRGQPKGLHDTGSGFPAVSPDGQTLAYVQSGRIQVASLDGRRIRELPVAGNPRELVWGPDGESLWYRLMPSGNGILQRYDLRTGAAVDVVDLQGGRWTLDSARPVVYEVRDPDSVPGGIWAYDYESGERRLVVESRPDSKYWAVSVSPDGGQLAYLSSDESASTHRLMVVPVEGGAPEEIHRVSHPHVFRIYWSADGTRILYLDKPDPLDASRGWVLMSVPVEGGEPTPVVQFDPELAPPLSINLSAGRMAFAAGFEKAELWKTEVGGGR